MVGSLALLGSAISCGSPTTCLAVGSNLTSNSDSITPIAEAWNGKAWRSVAVPRPKKAELTIVAIGETGASGGTTASPLGGLWNGSSWRLALA